MGERAHDFYPLASQKMACNGQKNCPECHAIVHISHSECLACRDRKKNAMNINTHQACVVTTATGSKDAMRSASVHAIMAPEKLALAGPARPKTAVDALEDKYRGVDPLAILDDLARLTSGGDGEPTMDEMEEKKRIAEEEKKEKEREKERERQRLDQTEQTQKDLALAKEQAERMEQDRKRKREAAQDLITAMLDAEDNAEAGQTTVAPVVVSAATSEAESEERRRKLLQQAEELKKKQEEMKQRQQADDAARRQRMRERRQRKVADATVVLD